MMKIIITIVSAAMAAFITIASAAQTPTPTPVASHSHCWQLDAFNAINAIKPEPKLVAKYLCQFPGDWKVVDVGGITAAVSPTQTHKSVNWVTTQETHIDARSIEMGVGFISAFMPGMEVDMSSLDISKDGKLGKRYFTSKFQVSYKGKALEMRQAYHLVQNGLLTTTFTYEVGDSQSAELWELLQQPPTLEVKPQRRLIREPVITLITPSQVEALLRTVVEEERKSSVPSMQEEMAQHRLDHIAHGLWYKPWTW